MSPTVGRAAGSPSGAGQVLAVGSPGADRITTALMQVLGRFCLEGVDIAEAIDRPRIHVTFRGEFTDPSPAAADAGDDTALPVEEPVAVVQVEDDDDLVTAVQEAGLEAVVHPRRSMFFGGVAAAYRRDDGTLGAAADARRESATGVS
jgi:gamma-glutamyltranspeptidase/glutathione hydrolase